MSAKIREEIQGFEYDWLAADSDGHVAFFSTAGGGSVPELFLRDVDRFDAVIAALVGRTSNNFAFDNDPHGGPYRLVAAPRKPVRLPQLLATLSLLERYERPQDAAKDHEERDRGFGGCEHDRTWSKGRACVIA